MQLCRLSLAPVSRAESSNGRDSCHVNPKPILFPPSRSTSSPPLFACIAQLVLQPPRTSHWFAAVTARRSPRSLNPNGESALFTTNFQLSLCAKTPPCAFSVCVCVWEGRCCGLWHHTNGFVILNFLGFPDFDLPRTSRPASFSSNYSE